MFFAKIKKSLRLKLLLNLLFVSLLPFALLFTYTVVSMQSKIVDKSIKEQYKRVQTIASLMDAHLQSLQKELHFLASLDLMDDILAEDIDKRVSILLAKKASDLGAGVTLMALTPSGVIVAASHNMLLNAPFAMPLEHAKNFSIVKGKLFLYTKIYASFNANKVLGYLVLRYDLAQLDKYLTHEAYMHSFITNKADFYLGDTTQLQVHLEKSSADVITKEHVIVYEQLGGMLENYYLVYGVDKSLALKFMYDFISFMLYVALFGIIVIVFLALRYSKSIVRPIEKLTDALQHIEQTQDYSHTLPVESSDEIGTLTDSFNDMLLVTSEALEALGRENRLRLERFIQLIEVFNSIIQTKDANECIDVAMAEIGKINLGHDLAFVKTKVPDGIDLYVKDYEANQKRYFGTIRLALENFEDTNEVDFYHSIANMIMLQLEKIALIQRTTAISNAKSAFISHMSHELRTPLHSIIGSSQFLIAYENMSDAQQDTIANIESSAHYLLNMINEILDIAKIESGKMQVHCEQTDLQVIVQNSYSMLQPLAEDKGLQFEIIVQKGQNLSVYTDAKIVQQIVINLLSNAIKFTEKGFVRIELGVKDDTIALEIVDSGIGIQQEDLSSLFDDFTQVNSTSENRYKGSGLGLSLSKKLAHLVDADVILESEGLGHGTRASLVFFAILL